jgi:hypothetical protein
VISIKKQRERGDLCNKNAEFDKIIEAHPNWAKEMIA